MLRTDLTRFLTVARFQHGVTQEVQDIEIQSPEAILIFYEQNRFISMKRQCSGREIFLWFDRFIDTRQIDLECRPHPDFTVHLNVTTALLYNAINRRQPQPRPFPLFFCGKEWFKDVGLGRNVNAKPSVSKGKKHVWTWTEGVRIFPRLHFVDHSMFGFD